MIIMSSNQYQSISKRWSQLRVKAWFGFCVCLFFFIIHGEGRTKNQQLQKLEIYILFSFMFAMTTHWPVMGQEKKRS